MSSPKPSTPDQNPHTSAQREVVPTPAGERLDVKSGAFEQSVNTQGWYIAQAKAPTGKPLASGNRFLPGVSLNAPNQQFDHSLVQRARRR